MSEKRRDTGVDARLIKPRRNGGKRRLAFFGGHIFPFPTQWRWWEAGNPEDVFDILTTEELHERLTEWSFAGHLVVGHLPDDGEVEQILEQENFQ